METLQLQLDVTRNLLNSLNTSVDLQEKIVDNFSSQASAAAAALENIKQASENMQTQAQTSQGFANSINNSISINNLSNKIESNANNLSQSLQEGLLQANNSLRQNNRVIDATNQKIKKSKKNILDTNEVFQTVSKLPDNINDINNSVQTLEASVENTTKVAGTMSNIVEMLSEIKDAFVTAGLSIVRTVLKGLLAFVKMAISAFTTLTGALVKMFIFTQSLPFTIANIAVELGNKIRTDLVEVIQTAGEEAKDSFDLTSDIGKGAVKLTKTAKGLMKTFESPRSRLARLFGMGASGAAAFLRATVSAVSDMGHYSEIFGPSILGNTKNAQYLVEMQKAMGIGAQEMAYYALESYNAGVSPIDTLHKTSQIIKGVADRYDFDFKALTKEFHTLRTNIVEFGHLSSNEIGNLVGKLRAMKVKTEDAVNVFKKFTSFEEAAKASAMLFQSFEMNVDAFDLLTARDPGEMLTQFRDSMFQTGKNFKDLNRHEKALMSSITGISEQSLSTLMNYMDLGLTQDEARKRMEQEDPTKEQTKMIKGLTSTIKQFQKTITFTSPFDAFFQGLLENQMNQEDLKVSLISLSEIYSDIRHIGFSLDLSQVTAILQPITEILRRIDILVNGNKFRQILTLATTSAAGFLDEVSYDLQGSRTGKEFTKLRYKIESIISISEKSKSVNADEINTAIINSLKSSITLDSLDQNILESLQKSGIVKKLKGGAYKFAEDLQASKVFSVFSTLSENNENDPKIKAAIEKLLKTSEKAYNAALTGTLDLTVKEINDEAQKRTSIKGRIDNLYNSLLEVVKEGKSTYKGFHDMGGNIMGSILRGIIKGITAGFYMLSGASSKAVESLGLEVTDQIRKDAKSKNMRPNDFTLLNHLGITEIDAIDLKEGLGKEIGKVIKRLPKMASIAVTITSHLIEAFQGFATGVLGLTAELLEEAFSSQPDLVQRYVSTTGKFNPTAMIARKRSQKSMIGTRKPTLGAYIDAANEFDHDDNATSMTESDMFKVLGANIAAFRQARKNVYHPDTAAYAFLNSDAITSFLSFIEKNSNFQGKFGLIKADDPDYGERLGALFSLYEKAAEIDSKSLNNQYIFDVFGNRDEFKIYAKNSGIKSKNAAEAKAAIASLGINTPEKMKSYVNKFPDIGTKMPTGFLPTSIPILGALPYIYNKLGAGGTTIPEIYSKTADKIRQFSSNPKTIDRNNNYSARLKIAFERLRLTSNNLTGQQPLQATEDISYSGKNAILITPQGKFVLDDHDSVLAAKKGGFLNNLFIEVTQIFNENTTKLLEFSNKKNADIAAKAIAICTELSENVIDSSKLNLEASEEDYIKIFDVYDEIINIISSKEILVSQNKVIIES